MKPEDHIPEIDPRIPENAVSIYGQSDAMDDFPVLKAFQQYIDSEQAKSRKRMLMLCIFFGAMMVVVIAVFLMLLLSVSSRNQDLSDRLFEYAIKERERTASPIVVQPPQQQQDNSAILALTAKIEEMQKAMNGADRSAEEVRRQPEMPHSTPEQIEIKRLSTLLAAEKEKRAAEKARREAEKERQRQIELEEYRRKHYPELYEKKDERQSAKPNRETAHEELLKEVDQILSDEDAISYYDDEEPVKKTKPRPAPAPQKEYSIPVDIRGSSSRWSVPND